MPRGHDVSGEARDSDGKWTKTGSTLSDNAAPSKYTVPPTPLVDDDEESDDDIRAVRRSENLARRLANGTFPEVVKKWKKVGGPGKSKPYKTLMDTEAGGQIEVLVKPAKNQRASAIRKGIEPGTELEREEAACVVNRALGHLCDMPEFITQEDTPMGRAGVQNFIPGGQTLVEGDNFAKYLSSWNRGQSKYLPTEDTLNIATLDAVIGNMDRHWGNVLVRKRSDSPLEDHLIAIDHGLSFPIPVVNYADKNKTNMTMVDYAEKHGYTLDFEQDSKLRRLLENRPFVDQQMERLNIPAEAVTEMWRRVLWMRENGTIPSSSHMRNRPWRDQEGA